MPACFRRRQWPRHLRQGGCMELCNLVTGRDLLAFQDDNRLIGLLRQGISRLPVLNFQDTCRSSGSQGQT